MCRYGNRVCVWGVFAGLLLLHAANAQATEALYVLTYDPGSLIFDEVAGYDVVRYADLDLSGEVGAPQVPVDIVHLAIPPGKRITSVVVEADMSEDVAGAFFLLPVQPPQPLSKGNVPIIAPALSYQKSRSVYPPDIVEMAGQGHAAGYNIGAFCVYPVQYDPAGKTLVLHTSISVRVTFADLDLAPVSCRRGAGADDVYRETLARLVENPAALRPARLPQMLRSSPLPSEVHSYVIITSDALAASFQPLADWKTKKGLSAEIVTTDWIYANYTGADNPERIRAFIQDAYQTWNTTWVLLGGDTVVVPDREAYAMDCEYGQPWHNNIPCDLYYADLDGDWNAHDDGVYGKLDDQVDMYADVYVGRAPVHTTTNVDAFVGKVLTYERDAPGGHELDALFLAELLWLDPYTDSGIGKDMIDDLYVPDRFDPVTKLYESLGNESPAAAIAALNAGANFINHDGHAWYTVMGVGNGYLYRSDMDALTNTDKYSVLFSIGCWPAAFDQDCIAEHFINNPSGGGVAFVGNSRYGWGSPGNPGYGYSDRFDAQFYKAMLQDGIHHVGQALAAAKAVYVPMADAENVYRWCAYEINLLGDPEMPVWTDTPTPLTVTHADALSVGTAPFPVTVTQGGLPVAGAVVCAMQDGAVYEVGRTDLDGQVVLTVATSDAANPLHVTVTAPNAIPHESTATMISAQPYAHIASYTTDGSGQGLVTPGGLVTMDVTVTNFGQTTAEGVSIELASDDEDVTIADGAESIGTLLAGGSNVVDGAFSFFVDPAGANGDTAYLEATITDASEHVWVQTLGVVVATPRLVVTGYEVSDHAYGDADGYAEPGEQVTLRVAVANRGLVAAHGATLLADCTDMCVDVPGGAVSLGTLPPGASAVGEVDVMIDPLCTAPAFPVLDATITATGSYTGEDSFVVSVGAFGFEDDMESGDANWTHGGAGDLWHLSSNRTHSGTHAWYSGDGGSYTYANGMAGALELTPVTIGQEAVLSFWCWNEFTTYGSDGLYVEANDGGGWTTLDYIGSGGALAALTIGNDWLKYEYDLSAFVPGTPLTVRFRLVTDGEDVAEGAYIDDISIRGAEWPTSTGPTIPAHPAWGPATMTVLLLAAGLAVWRRR